jgi:TonB family protein
VANVLSAADAIIEDVEEGEAGKVMPKIVSQPPLVYPASLAKSRISGKVIVTFTVDPDGSVRDALVSSSTQRQLNSHAIKAVSQWKFEPGTLDGQPATFHLRAPVEFTPPKEEETAARMNKSSDIAPVVKRRAPSVCPYEIVISGQPALADTSFAVDYLGRSLFAVSPASSNKAFAKAAVAMVEASEYNPGKKGSHRAMSLATEHFQFDGELSLDPDSRRVLAELRKPHPAIIAVAELDERPKVMKQVAPVYPRALKDDGLTGQAEIEFIISRDGTVMFPKIVTATHEDFGWAASVAVVQWRYHPPRKDGHPVEVRMTVPVLFTAQKLAEVD